MRVPSAIGFAWKPGRGDDREVGHVAPRLLDRRFFRNIVRAKRLCHAFWVTMRTAQPVLGVGPAVDVLHEDVAALQVAAEPRVQRAEALRVEGPVVLAPPDVLLGRLLAHDELVGGGAGGVLAGVRPRTGPWWRSAPRERWMASS